MHMELFIEDNGEEEVERWFIDCVDGRTNDLVDVEVLGDDGSDNVGGCSVAGDCDFDSSSLNFFSCSRTFRACVWVLWASDFISLDKKTCAFFYGVSSTVFLRLHNHSLPYMSILRHLSHRSAFSTNILKHLCHNSSLHPLVCPESGLKPYPSQRRNG